MFVGHLGAGLALRSIEPRLNAGVLVFAALFSDVVLWILILAGVEHVHVPADFASLRYQTFTFPWSHSLVASILWSAVAFGVIFKVHGNPRCAALAAAAVFSHFILDAVEHPAELPIFDESSPKVGLGLWNAMGWALLLEFGMAMGGLSLYLVDTQNGVQSRRVGMFVLIVAMVGLAIPGQWFAKEPPSTTFGAVSSLITIGIVSVLAGVLDRGVSTSASGRP